MEELAACLPIDESLVEPGGGVGCDAETVPGLQLPGREEVVARIEGGRSVGLSSDITVS